MHVCFKKIRLVRAIACVPVRYICLCNCVLVSWRGRHTIFIRQLPHRGSPKKQVQGHDRDRATAAFCWCNRKLIETINTVLIIKAQVLRWHFADCYSVGSRRKLPQHKCLTCSPPPPLRKSRVVGEKDKIKRKTQTNKKTRSFKSRMERVGRATIHWHSSTE